MKNQESWVNVAFLLLIPLLILAGYKASLDPARAAAPPGAGVSPRLSAFIGAGPGTAQLAPAVVTASVPISSDTLNTASGSAAQALPLPDEPGGSSQALAEFRSEPTPLYIQSGTYARAGASPQGEAVATIEQLGDNRYRLHAGGLDAEFSMEGQVVAFRDDAFRELSLALDDASLTIDYPANAFGEPGADVADVRGIYYLREASSDESPFLRSLYDSIQLSGSLRQGEVVITTYLLDSDERLLLLDWRREEGDAEAEMPVIVRYHPATGRFTPIPWDKAQETLRLWNASEAMVYEITHKAYADRYREVLADRAGLGKPEDAPLSEQEAFFIATGERSVTRTELIRTEPEAAGTKYIQEVDSADEAAVIVHLYDLVEEGEEAHAATVDWLEVDRRTGRVSSMFEA